MDKLKAMRIFTRVVENSSFTKAAESLGFPKATVTLAVKNLEDSLAIRLLNRNTRNISFTREGQQYYEACRTLLQRLDETEQLLHSKTSNNRGHIRVDVSSAIARSILIPKLPEFTSKNPNISLSISVGDEYADLVKKGIDCAIRVGNLNDSSLIAKHLGFIDFIMCGSPSYFSNKQVPSDLTSLGTHTVVRYISRQTGRPLDWMIEKGSDVISLDLPSKLTVNDAESYIECGLQGLGLVMPARFMAAPLVHAEKLIHILPDVRSPKLSISIVYPHRTPVNSNIKIFTDWISMTFEDFGFQSYTPG